jgi:quercetin dioxygenase-like cupin family protein
MKYVLARMSILIGCMCLAFASASSWAQHASPGAHPASSASPPAGLADAKVEFENEAIIVMRVRMAPHEKTPMHDITSARLVVWLTDAHLRDTHPDGSANETHRHAGEIDWVGAQRHAGENLSHEPLEFLAIVPKAERAAAPR